MVQPTLSLIKPKLIKAPARRGLKLKTAIDMLREGKKLYRSTRCGDLSTSDGYRLMVMLRALCDLATVAELEEKLTALETAAAGVARNLNFPSSLAARPPAIDHGGADE